MLIIGAGKGGHAAARALKRIGVEVHAIGRSEFATGPMREDGVVLFRGDAADRRLLHPRRPERRGSVVRFDAKPAFSDATTGLHLADELAGCQGRNSQLAGHGGVKDKIQQVLLLNGLRFDQCRRDPGAVRTLYTRFGQRRRYLGTGLI